MQVYNLKLDFIVVGAERCGTTWLADMLRQHRDVFIPVQKEIHYFNRKFVDFPDIDNYNFDKPINWYWQFYAEAAAKQKKGEVCPSYLWDVAAAERIHAFDPEIKIMVMLRNPIERTFSAYRFWMQRGVVRPMPFREAVKRYSDLLLQRSMYFDQLTRYYNFFPKEQIRVWCTDSSPVNTMVSFLKDAEDFMGVPQFVPENASARSNVTSVSRFWIISWLMARFRRFFRRYRAFSRPVDLLRKVKIADQMEFMRRQNMTETLPTEISMMTEQDRIWLTTLLQKDIQNLEALLKIDLSAWRS
jgi:Sulfotransferase domain